MSNIYIPWLPRSLGTNDVKQLDDNFIHDLRNRQIWISRHLGWRRIWKKTIIDHFLSFFLVAIYLYTHRNTHTHTQLKSVIAAIRLFVQCRVSLVSSLKIIWPTSCSPLSHKCLLLIMSFLPLITLLLIRYTNNLHLTMIYRNNCVSIIYCTALLLSMKLD